MTLIQDVDKLKRKLRHEENVHSILNTCFLSCQEQSRSGCTRIEKARHWRWISWDVILTYCLRMQNLFDCFKHALPFYHLLPIFSHQLAGYAWFLNTPEQSLSFILTDQGFDVWVENVHETRWSHGHRSYSVKNKKFLNWSWQELALYDMAEMINYIYSVTNSKLFIVGYSQMTTGFIQMVLTMGIHQLNFKSE
ncbi:hypothetical protein AAHE18_04G114900 [Arachis hypogaea]